MIRIGLVNIDVSHPLAFAKYLANETRARYVAVYNDGFREDDEVEGFVKNYNLEKRCPSVEELAECSDIGFIQGCNWDKHLGYAVPFIQRGKPVFIDKPIVGSEADCRKLEELVKRGAVILGSSSVRYCREIMDFVSKSEDEVGRVLTVFGTAGVDEFNYGIHIAEGIGGILGTGAVASKFVGRAQADGKICETFHVRYENGTTAAFNNFHGVWHPFEVVIMTTKGTYQFRIDNKNLYGSLLDRICLYMETGENTLAPIETITESIRIMLASKISKEQGGKEILLSDIPADYPGYDGDEFESGYSKKAGKIYL